MDMLEENGEVDIVPMLRKTPEREERFDFSAEPISNIATMLTVKAGNRSIVAGNYDTFDGMVVGMSHGGNGRNRDPRPTLRRKTALPTRRSILTPMRNFPPHCAAAPSAAVSNRMRQTSNEWVIDTTFDNEDVYIAVRKGDASTLRLVNDAR